MSRDIADALISVHPKSEGDYSCCKYNNLSSFIKISLLNNLSRELYRYGDWENIIYSSQNVQNELLLLF